MSDPDSKTDRDHFSFFAEDDQNASMSGTMDIDAGSNSVSSGTVRSQTGCTSSSLDDQGAQGMDLSLGGKVDSDQRQALAVENFLSDGKYKILRLLGEGGMGRVYLAQDPRLKREVAIKIMRSGKDEQLRLRFLEEAQVLGQLEHPNIVPIYDLAHIGSTHMYCVMRYVRGLSLREVLRTQRAEASGSSHSYSLLRLMQIYLQIVQAASYAHARGVVHRDLKPGTMR